ncbi:MAG TPA: hypothetical protein VFZ16_04730 [Hyphomicrobiaceae bacterium]|nr:hypothetical protein [Hyphomicrobiaceae bacterium]
MRAESNGRSHAKNPRSSALGPYQFINSTFLAVMRRHFPDEIANKSERQILALRTNHEYARRAAEAFTRENMDYLVERGIKPTFGHLRLAFLLGPQGAARVLLAPADQRLTRILDDGVIHANPFMRRMSAADLVARATRDVSPKDVPAPAPEAVPATIVADNADNAPAATPPSAPVADGLADKVADGDDVVAEPQLVEQPRPIQVADAGPEVAAQPGEAGTAIATDATAPAVAAASPPMPASAAAEETPAAVAEAPKADTVKAEVADKDTEKAPQHTAASIKPVRKNGGVAVINVKCDDRQASCRRWIDQQVAALIKG